MDGICLSCFLFIVCMKVLGSGPTTTALQRQPPMIQRILRY